MRQLTINPNNRQYYSEDFIKGFNCGAQRQFEADSADNPQEWIPCGERLPNEKEIVLITNDKGNVRFGQFRGTHGKYWIWKSNTLETVLAWMPLPKPWKGADDDSKRD